MFNLAVTKSQYETLHLGDLKQACFLSIFLLLA